MAWVYRAFANDDVNIVLNQMVDFLNQPGKGDLTVKFDASNQHAGDARAVVYYQEGSETPRAQPSAEQFSWNAYTVSGATDYKHLYDVINEALNTRKAGNIHLTEWQVLNSRVVFTNQYDGDATLSLVYPTE